MDIRTGRIYETLADALKDGVPESDVARKHRPFASFKNVKGRTKAAFLAEYGRRVSGR